MSEPETELTYRAAADEIERTLREIENEQSVDIDELAERVERASDLIQFCLDRLKQAEVRVRKVTEKLETRASTDEAE